MYAFLFPGQGSQYIGMGQSLFDAFSEAKEVFQEVDDTLEQNLSKLMFSGDEADLKLTENTQPALMAVSLAVQRVLHSQFNTPLTRAAYTAGHSLGEYAALCATGVYSLDATARLLKKRGQAMQKAVPVGKGGMAALIGATIEQAEEIALKAQEQHQDQAMICEVANDNAPGQIVISGHADAIKSAIEIAKEMAIKRALPLPVSAPFHSSLMGPAVEDMKFALREETIRHMPLIPVVSNVTATPLENETQVSQRLLDQITGRVRWVESMGYIADQGVTHYIELGAGKVLSGLMKRINKEAIAISVETPDDIEDLANLMSEQT